MSDLRVMQWNVGGYYSRDMRSPAADMYSYNQEDLDHFTEVIEAHDPDVVTLQETHAIPGESQTAVIAERLGYRFSEWRYSPSHIDTTYQLGQAVLSRTAQFDPGYQRLPNPDLEVEGHPDFGDIVSHSKKLSWTRLVHEGVEVTVATFHGQPFRIFGLKVGHYVEFEAQDEAIAQALPNDERLILGADMNFDSERGLDNYPNVARMAREEVPVECDTAPTRKKLDHIAFRGFVPVAQHVDQNVLSDHYPVLLELDFE